MDDATQKKIDDFIRDIGEHFESARFFGTFAEGNGETGSYTVGHGNFHAQRGNILEWMLQQDEMTRLQTRKRMDEL